MISREIEKEIKQENKVILNFTSRQVICLSAALVFSVFISIFLGLDFEMALFPCFIMGVLCFAFGWLKQDGIPMERILWKRLQVALYRNDMRVYKTKNRYIAMLNREYDRRRQIDRRDRAIKRQIKREKRKNKKLKKKSMLERRKIR